MVDTRTSEGIKVKPDFDRAEAERGSLANRRLGRETGSGMCEDRCRVEQRPAAFPFRRISGIGEQESSVHVAQRDEVVAPAAEEEEGHRFQGLYD